MITITNTITIAIITIAIIPLPSSPSAPDRMRTHTPTIGGKRAADPTGKSESEICSPQDLIVYPFCRIQGCNCQHHDHEASWDLIVVAALKIRLRLWYQPMSWYRPPNTTNHPPPATRHPPPATCLPVPGACHSASLWIEHLEHTWEHIVKWDWECLAFWECTWERARECAWVHLESILRAYLGVYSQAQ